MAMFWVAAAAMLAVALAFVLWPLLSSDPARARRRALERAQRDGVLSADEVRAKLVELGPAPASAPPRVLFVALMLLLPLSAIAIYYAVGDPRALDPMWSDAAAIAAKGTSPEAAPGEAPDMERAVSSLAERLREQPDDLDGWMLLGRAYKTMERFEPAREALANAYRLAPENADVLVDYAEAQVLASSSRRFEGEARTMLDRALVLQPEHHRGLWLLGVASYQSESFAEAVTTWEKLLTVLPDDADARASLLERITDARQRAGLEPLAATPAAPTKDAESATTIAVAPNAPRLTVSVDIAPELKAKIGASDVLFVFARAAQGPRMPLAIQRLSAAQLPVTVTLDDADSMMEAMKLSTIPQVVVGARVSKSGQATPQPGDFEALSEPIPNSRTEPVHLLIERVVP